MKMLSLILILAAAPALSREAPPPWRMLEYIRIDSDIIPIRRAIAIAVKRFPGRVLGVELDDAPDHLEDRLDVDDVYQMRILTPRRDVVDVTLDAETGRFLEVRGRDITAARKR